MRKILIATSTFNEKYIKYLKKNNFQIILNNSGQKVDSQFLKRKISDIDAIIAGTENYTFDILNKAKHLKVISRLGVGADNIDFVECKKRNIKIHTSKVDLSKIVAEHSIAMILNCLKKINYFDLNFRKGIWKKSKTESLSNKKIGIIGFGKIGKEIFRLTKPFNMKYYFNDKIKKTPKNVKYMSLRKIFTTCDIITIHLPFNKITHNIINNKVLPTKDSKIIIVNTSRGGVINEDHLFKFLKKNEQAFACLDVFKQEPYLGKLKNLKNTILTPHVSGYSHHIREQMEQEAINNIQKELKSYKLIKFN